MILVTWNAEARGCRFNASLSYIARPYLRMKILKKGCTSEVEHLLRLSQQGDGGVAHEYNTCLEPSSERLGP